MFKRKFTWQSALTDQGKFVLTTDYHVFPTPFHGSGHLFAEIWEGAKGLWQGRAYRMNGDGAGIGFDEKSDLPGRFAAECWAMRVLLDEGERIANGTR